MRSSESPPVRTYRLSSSGSTGLSQLQRDEAQSPHRKLKRVLVMSAGILVDHLQQLVVHRLPLIF
jgi:hypothetical protein